MGYSVWLSLSMANEKWKMMNGKSIFYAGAKCRATYPPCSRCLPNK